MADNNAQEPREHEEPSVTDRRRVDPETGEVRDAKHTAGAATSDPAGAASPDQHPASDDPKFDEALQDLIEEEASSADVAAADSASDPHLEDLKRLSAEYANYRRRTEKEKAESREVSTVEVLRQLLPVLDDLDRAEKHGDLTPETPMAVIAAKLRGAVAKLGLEEYGESGEPFDAKLHEAIAQLPNPEVSEPTVADVIERGYTLGDRTVRFPKVAVFVPAT